MEGYTSIALNAPFYSCGKMQDTFIYPRQLRSIFLGRLRSTQEAHKLYSIKNENLKGKGMDKSLKKFEV